MIFSNIDPEFNRRSARLAAIREAQVWRSQEARTEGFDLDGLRDELVRALTLALAKDRLGRKGSVRRARREAFAGRAARMAPVESHRLEPTPIIPAPADWYSDAPKATGEAQDVLPDEPGDEELRDAARWLQLNPEPLDAEEWIGWSRRFERLFSVSMEDADSVPLRTLDAIQRDEDDARFAARDSAPAPRGFGMTSREERRAWLMNARLRYADLLREAVAKHRGRVSKAQANTFPALRSEAQYVRSVMMRWAFVDELARHRVFEPDTELVAKLKVALGGTYADAVETLVRRRDAAERGLVDRYRHELV